MPRKYPGVFRLSAGEEKTGRAGKGLEPAGVERESFCCGRLRSGRVVQGAKFADQQTAVGKFHAEIKGALHQNPDSHS
jgi:hypothetical protein